MHRVIMSCQETCCVLKKKASSICKDCLTYLCFYCEQEHQMIRSYQNHKVIMILNKIYSFSCMYVILRHAMKYACHVTWYICSEADMT